MQYLLCIECGCSASAVGEIGASMLCARCERVGLLEAPIRYAAALAREEIEADEDMYGVLGAELEGADVW